MQAFIKGDKLIVNTMIQENEKEALLDYINKVENKLIRPTKLYDIEGNVSGIAFELI